MHPIVKATLFAFCIMLARTVAAQEINLFDYARGARVVYASSNYGGGWDVQNLLEHAPTHTDEGDLPVWCTEGGAGFPHMAIVELPQTEWLTVLRFNNAIPDEETGYPGIAAKDIEVYVSATDATTGFRKILALRLENNKNAQVIKITPVQARWVKFIITSNYGNEFYTELGQLGVYDDKSRPGDITSELSRQGFSHLYGIYFDFASATLRAESQASIQQLLQYLQANPSQSIVIEGHTDNIGNDADNRQLSLKRAESVRDELIRQGIDGKRLTAKGMGATQPVAPNTTEAGRAQNRRVTVRL